MQPFPERVQNNDRKEDEFLDTSELSNRSLQYQISQVSCHLLEFVGKSPEYSILQTVWITLFVYPDFILGSI